MYKRQVLYRKAEGGLQALGGEVPFDETVNVPDLDEHDYTQVSWTLEDLNTSMKMCIRDRIICTARESE